MPALTATANANQIFFLMIGAVFGVSMAANIMIGQAIGARNEALAKKVVGACTTFFIVVISFIGGLQGSFEQARVMTEGKPANTTVTLAYYIYIKAFEQFQMGYASAISWVLFSMIFVITLLNWRLGRSAAVAD